MTFLKDNLPWMASTAAVVLLAMGYIDRSGAPEEAETPVVAAAPIATPPSAPQ